MAKVNDTEIGQILNQLLTRYRALDKRKTIREHVERFDIGSKTFKISISHDDDDKLIIRLTER